MRQIVTIWMMFFAVQAFTQTPQVRLDLGPVTVWLGMPKSEVLRKFSDSGYKLGVSGSDGGIPPDGRLLTAINKNPFGIEESRLNVYFLAFTAGRLSFAERSWFDEKDPLASVVEAIGALTGRGSRSCSVTYSPISDPAMSSSRVFIECDKRSVVLVRGEYDSAGSKHPHFEVSEYIGNPPGE